MQLDALDLVMTVLREHEKMLDHTVVQLTFLAKSLEQTNMRFNDEMDFIHEKLSRKPDIRIPDDLLQKAHKLGLNVSDIFEKALKESFTQRIK